MNHAKHLINLLLVLLIASTGVPVYLAEDASRNGTVDLQDVILQVQDFSDAADSSTSFSFSFTKTLNTLSSVAGLKNLVSPDREGKSSKHYGKVIVAPDRITNLIAVQPPPLLTAAAVFTENLHLYRSRSLDPATPPPRTS